MSDEVTDARIDTLETQIQQILDAITATQNLLQLQVWLSAQNIAPPVIEDPPPTNPDGEP